MGLPCEKERGLKKQREQEKQGLRGGRRIVIGLGLGLVMGSGVGLRLGLAPIKPPEQAAGMRNLRGLELGLGSDNCFKMLPVVRWGNRVRVRVRVRWIVVGWVRVRVRSGGVGLGVAVGSQSSGLSLG